jgi:flagellar biosynthetic protein FliQ
MDSADVIFILRQLLYLAVLLSAPVVGISLLVGLLISVLQTLTSIQEQTLTFAPRIIAVAVTIAVALPWLLGILIEFTHDMFSRIGQVTA